MRANKTKRIVQNGYHQIGPSKTVPEFLQITSDASRYTGSKLREIRSTGGARETARRLRQRS